MKVCQGRATRSLRVSEQQGSHGISCALHRERPNPEQNIKTSSGFYGDGGGISRGSHTLIVQPALQKANTAASIAPCRRFGCSLWVDFSDVLMFLSVFAEEDPRFLVCSRPASCCAPRAPPSGALPFPPFLSLCVSSRRYLNKHT